jgi:hypothetical protein
VAAAPTVAADIRRLMDIRPDAGAFAALAAWLPGRGASFADAA